MEKNLPWYNVALWSNKAEVEYFVKQNHRLRFILDILNPYAWFCCKFTPDFYIVNERGFKCQAIY